ncbi:MAG: methyltransferase domain-containing protein [Oscillospiraceae bacterium]|nr:methyltransferase domain-containing protein [Oscillospiraceae bacterium]
MFKYGSDIYFTPNTSHGKIVDRVAEGSKVLEFGCATGYMSKYLKEEKHCRVYGAEISSEALSEASQYLEKAVCCDAESGEWAEQLKGEQFDYILFADILEHLRDPKAVLERASDFLKDDGCVIISVPNITHSDILLKMLHNHFEYTKTGLLDNTHIHFWGSSELKPFFESCGFYMAVLDGTIIPVGSTEQKMSNINKDLVRLISAKAYGNIYQFVCVLYKKEYAQKQNMEQISLIGENNPDSMYYELENGHMSNSHIANVFFDRGNGFNEYDKISFEYIGEELDGGRIVIPADCCALRFDPCEGDFIIVHEIKAITNSGIAEVIPVNSLYSSGFVFFNTTDPQYTVKIPENAKWIEFSGTVTNISSQRLYGSVMSFIETIAAAEAEKNKLLTVMDEKDRLYNELKAADDEKLQSVISEKDRLYSELKAADEEKLQSVISEKDRLYNELKAAGEEKLRSVISEKDRLYSELKAADEKKLYDVVNARDSFYSDLKAEEKAKLSDIDTAINACKNELMGKMETVIINQNKAFAYDSNEKAELITQRDEALRQLEEIRNSKCWKLTSPLRHIGDLLRRRK